MFNSFLKNTKGVSTVEFAFTAGIFFMVIFMFFEFTRITLISSYLDLSIAEATRLTRIASYNHDLSKGDFDYRGKFISYLKKSKFKFDEDLGENFRVSVDYFDNTDGLTADTENARVQIDDDGNPIVNSRGAKLARYSVSYDYKGLISSVSGLLKDLVQNLVFERRFIMVQEYERD